MATSMFSNTSVHVSDAGRRTALDLGDPDSLGIRVHQLV
jgi:hypothetical protein